MTVADKMRSNVEKYKKSHIPKQKKYIKTLYKEIDRISKIGGRVAYTLDTNDISGWFTMEFFDSLPSIFIADGFDAERKISKFYGWKSWWEISW